MDNEALGLLAEVEARLDLIVEDSLHERDVLLGRIQDQHRKVAILGNALDKELDAGIINESGYQQYLIAAEQLYDLEVAYESLGVTVEEVELDAFDTDEFEKE